MSDKEHQIVYIFEKLEPAGVLEMKYRSLETFPIHSLKTQTIEWKWPQLWLSNTDPSNSEDPLHAREQKVKGSSYHNLVKSNSKTRSKRKAETGFEHKGNEP